MFLKSQHTSSHHGPNCKVGGPLAQKHWSYKALNKKIWFFLDVFVTPRAQHQTHSGSSGLKNPVSAMTVSTPQPFHFRPHHAPAYQGFLFFTGRGGLPARRADRLDALLLDEVSRSWPWRLSWRTLTLATWTRPSKVSRSTLNPSTCFCLGSWSDKGMKQNMGFKTPIQTVRSKLKLINFSWPLLGVLVWQRNEPNMGFKPLRRIVQSKLKLINFGWPLVNSYNCFY